MNRQEALKRFQEETGQSLTTFKRFWAATKHLSTYEEAIEEWTAIKISNELERRNKISKTSTGKTHIVSEETKQKISKSVKAKINSLSEEERKNIYGHKVSEEEKAKISNSLKEYFSKNEISKETIAKLREAGKKSGGHNKGISTPYEIKQKISETEKDFWSTHKEELKKRTLNQIQARKDGKCNNKYIFNGIPMDSSYEVWFALFLHLNDISFEKDYTIDIDGHSVLIDFKVGNKLYELKGLQFFNKEGKMYIPYGEEKNLTPWKEKAYEQYNVHIITDIEPYKKFVEETSPLHPELFKVNAEFPYDDPIYKCHKKGQKSPYEAFYDMELREKMIINRMNYGRCGRLEEKNWENGKFIGKNKIELEDIVRAFSVTRIATKVSVLKESIVEPFIQKGMKVVNPFFGFGATLKQCEKVGATCVGYDLDDKCPNIKGNKILGDITKIKDSNEYDLLIACPPYADKEEWLTPMPVIKTCDEWIDFCLETFNAKKYVFIVDESKKYKYSDEIVNKSHFGSNNEHIIIIEK